MGSIYRSGRFDLTCPNLLPNDHSGVLTPAEANTCTGEATAVPCDYFDGVFEYINQMLMDEDDDLDYRPCMFQDCSALQACEKYFYNALTSTSVVHHDDAGFRPRQASVPDHSRELGHSDGQLQPVQDGIGNLPGNSVTECVDIGKEHSCESNRGKNHGREDREEEYGRSSKQLAVATTQDSPEPIEEYDRAFLCEKMNPGFYDDSPVLENSGDEVDKKYQKLPVVKRGRPKGSTKKKQTTQAKEVVVLQILLTRCAQAVSNFNFEAAKELLMKIRQHSSPYGDANERMAHCFANALDARIAGTGPMMYAAFASRRIPASDILRAYKTYVTACPFKRMSNIFANKTIAKRTREADKIHIVDFGILYGFQWPCIIQGVSLRPGGPPTLKITGIDYPQPGFKPAERVEQTGRRLMSYCRRFNVPFEYNAVAKKWEDVTMEDLKLENDEMLVANCLYRLRHVPDESAGVDSPRDAVLSLISRIKPVIFVHGVVNGTYGGAAFFATRFREALYHYTSLFDVMEATLRREDRDRLMQEQEVLGREVMNLIACEGAERVDRPEGYKQWQVRNRRAGFRQVALDRDVVEEVRVKVGKGYQGDFMVEEESEWLLQGWKGRALYALSCWITDSISSVEY